MKWFFLVSIFAISAHGFVLPRPLETLSPDWNLSVSKSFGPQMASAAFDYEIMQNSDNALARQAALDGVARQLRDRAWSPLKKQNITIVVNTGLSWDDKMESNTPLYVHEFVLDMRALGVPVVFLQKDPYGTIWDNALSIQPQLEKVLQQGRDIFIITLCKGTPEMMLALTRAQTSYVARSRTQEHRPKGTAKVIGYLNMSGMMSGTFLADSLSESKTLKYLGNRMRKWENSIVGEYGKTTLSLPYMTSDEISDVLSITASLMPKDVSYMNIVGNPVDRAFLERGSIIGPFFKLNDYFNFYSGAHDGYLDVTQIAFPKSVSENQVTITFNASHLLTDGFFGPFDLMQPFARQAIYRSLINVTLDRVQ
jgi:hypothetical protein